MNIIKKEQIFQTAKRVWRPFILQISISILIFSLIFFVILFFRNKQLIETEHIVRARSYYEHIIVTRSWVSNYGGVYIEKTESVKSNPYLHDPDIKSTNGKTYTLRNPSLVTIELSEYAKINNFFSYHMTSLNPVNPQNKPDEFEKKALDIFERGQKEIWIKEKKGNQIYFRYMAPIFRENSCLNCHVEQKQINKTDSNIRGGISVKFDISDIENTLKLHSQLIIFLGFLSTSIFLGIVYCFVIKLMKAFSESQRQIQEMAITDELTKLYNRRYFYSKLNEEFEKAQRYKRDISCIMIDIDFFKKVNDQYGHDTGDNVLRAVSNCIKSTCRSIDIVARYGGEEIIILLPETDKFKAALVAEKIRKLIENKEIAYDKEDKTVKVTISLGVADFVSDDIVKHLDPNQFIKNADSALYHAKNSGRNRVEIFST
ncbi:MAG: diguanylate cyclase [Desulfamplus sp.]|nr:diguanylate cyclase [Desulfamplus sp.]